MVCEQSGSAAQAVSEDRTVLRVVGTEGHASSRRVAVTGSIDSNAVCQKLRPARGWR